MRTCYQLLLLLLLFKLYLLLQLVTLYYYSIVTDWVARDESHIIYTYLLPVSIIQALLLQPVNIISNQSDSSIVDTRLIITLCYTSVSVLHNELPNTTVIIIIIIIIMSQWVWSLDLFCLRTVIIVDNDNDSDTYLVSS